MKRREFIKSSSFLAMATGIGNVANAYEPSINQPVPHDGRLIASAPMLQNYAATSMGIAFAVSDLANGYALVGEKPDLSDARKVLCGGFRTTDITDHVQQIRLTGLKPSTIYYYRNHS